jgi:alpha-glucosidase
MTRRKDSTLPKEWARDPAPVRVRPRTLRFRAPDAAGPPPPSAAIIGMLDDVPAEAPIAFAPEFAPGPGGRRFLRLRCPPGTSFYATGEVAGPLRRNGRTTNLWNTDSFGYDLETPSLYQSHPWVLGLLDEGRAFGLLLDTTRRCEFSLDDDLVAWVEGPGPGEAPGEAPAVYLLEAESPQEVLKELAALIGTMPLPPMWALGFHQCRYSYGAEHEVLGIAEEFRERWLPCDTLWLDIDHMDGARSFTIDKHRFPDPEKMIAQLKTKGFRTVWILDPGIKVDPKDRTYASGLERGVFIRTPDGKPFEGDVWPGRSSWPDFTRADTRRWWGDLTARFVRAGADGVWNDMNEPSVFDGVERTMPVTCTHDADPELGGPDTHARYHNIYGMLMARASFEGLLRERPDRRPFVLSRSNFLGGHRYACCWTGDSASTWEHLSWTIPMMLNLGLSGQPFSGCDIGGFADNADDVLFARWMGIGCLLPFARAHSDKNTNRHEPWSFGAACENACRLALERRYRLLPYYYTLFHEAERTGLPPMRPLFFADPADPRLRDAEDSFLLGRDLLVRAASGFENTCRAPMPRGVWRRFEAAERTDPQLPHLYLRAGAILPVGPIMQHTRQRPLDPITLLISPDENGYAEGMLYEDDGEGFGYRSGDYLLTTYAAQREENHMRVWIKHAEGRRPRPLRIAEILVLLDNGSAVRATGVGGDLISVLLGPPDESPISPAD